MSNKADVFCFQDEFIGFTRSGRMLWFASSEALYNYQAEVAEWIREPLTHVEPAPPDPGLKDECERNGLLFTD